MVTVLRKSKIQSKGIFVKYVLHINTTCTSTVSLYLFLFLYIKVCLTCNPISKDLKFIDENSHYFITRCFMKYIIFIACYFII